MKNIKKTDVDRLKWHISNSSLWVEEILENYNHLWQIEKAFIVSKTDLKIRPIYNRLPKRIKAHICLTLVAYKVYKELERQLILLDSPIKVEKAIEIAESIFQIEIRTPNTKRIINKILLFNEEQKLLAKILNLDVSGSDLRKTRRSLYSKWLSFKELRWLQEGSMGPGLPFFQRGS